MGPYGQDQATLARIAPEVSRTFGVAPSGDPGGVQIQVRVEAQGPLGTSFAQAQRALEGFEDGLLHHYIFLAAGCSSCAAGLACGPCGCEPLHVRTEDSPPASWGGCAPDAGPIETDGGPPVDLDQPELWRPDRDLGVLDVLDPVVDEDGPDAGVADIPLRPGDLGGNTGREDARIERPDRGLGPVDAAPNGRFDTGINDAGPRPDFGELDGSVNNGRD